MAASKAMAVQETTLDHKFHWQLHTMHTFISQRTTLVSQAIVQDGINVQDGHFLGFPARLFGWFK